MRFTTVDTTHAEQAMHILCAAFHDDPILNWCCNHPPSLLPFFKLTLPTFLPHRLTYLDPQGRGIASWLGPNQTLTWPFSLASAMQLVKVGGAASVYRMLISGIKTAKHHPTMPHYYLFAIGVRPEHKGMGVGTHLITHVLQRCDLEGMPAYLENSKEENLAFYAGHGFTVQKKIQFAASAPPLWLMWREPAQHKKNR